MGNETLVLAGTLRQKCLKKSIDAGVLRNDTFSKPENFVIPAQAGI
jgi:hypothetical protein